MEVSYQLTPEDFRQGIIAHRNKNWRSRWGFRILFGVVTVMLGMGLIMLALRPDQSTFQSVRPLFAVCAIWLAILLLAPRLSARNQFRGTPSAQNQMTLGISEEGVRLRSVHSDSILQWLALTAWVEGKKIFALFTNPRIFVPIPKRAFTVGQLEEFRELLRSNIKKPRGLDNAV